MDAPLKLIAVFNEPELNFSGNTSAVLLTDKALPENRMRQIAADFNQPATTFLWPAADDHSFNVRWLAPDGEIGLCGHGSLAAIAFLSEVENWSGPVNLRYKQGSIAAYKNNNGTCSIELPVISVTGELEVSDILKQGLGIPVKEHFTTDNKHIVVVENERDLKNMKPDFAKLRESNIFGYSVTAQGHGSDFISRTLVPHVQQLEDPATGSSHAALAPFWSKRLGKTNLTGLQLSARGGKFICEVKKDVVVLSGKYMPIASGNLLL